MGQSNSFYTTIQSFDIIHSELLIVHEVNYRHVRYDILTAVLLNTEFLWCMMLCCLTRNRTRKPESSTTNI